ncbi:MAG: hypothetical protein RR415_11535 [Ruthenibacterium sp.]
MRSSSEIKMAAEAAGMWCEVLTHGMSYRDGGTIVLSRGNWREFVRFSVKETGEAFDGTGYKGRGEHYSVLLLSEGGEWRIATRGEYDAVDENQRRMIGVTDVPNAGRGEFLVKVDADTTSDLNALLGLVDLSEELSGLPLGFVNLTPHVVRLNDGTAFSAEGFARVASSYTAFDKNGIAEVKFGDVEGLPEEQAGVRYIVSALVKQAAKDRHDLVSPATGHPDAIRKDGQIVSVPGFVK